MDVTRRAYADFLKSYHWDYFFTSTFRSPRVEPYYAHKHVWSELQKHGVVRAFLGVEPHKSGDLHVHGIVAGPGGDWRPQLSLPWDIYDGLFDRFGRAKVGACNSSENVTAYCAKYVLKAQSHVVDHYHFYGNAKWWGEGKEH